MTPPRLVRSWLCAILAMATGASLVRGDDVRLAPNHTVGHDAKVVHPVISPVFDYIYWLNQSDGTLQRASLDDSAFGHTVEVAAGARDFCIASDGSTAFVAATPNEYSAYREGAKQHGTIQSINLQDFTVAGSFDVAIDPLEIVVDGRRILYVTPGSGQWEKIYKIDPQQKKILFGFGSVYGGSNLRITPNRQRLYLATNGLSPGDLSATPIPADAKSAASPVDSPYHGEYPLGGAFDITPDGKYAVNRHGIVVRLGTVKGADLLFVTKVEPNLGTACDPIHGKLWAIQADGHLLTYTYPAFKLEKSELLLSHGEAIAYDATRQTLWVAWAGSAGGVGGLDAYNLARPATYPNDITKAREGASEPVNPAPAPTAPSAAPTPAPASAAHALPSSVSRATAPATPAAAAASAPPQPAPTSPSVRAANLAAVHSDLVARGLLALCGLLLAASIFSGRRTPREHALHGSPVDLDDPSNWPVPGSIKFIGWFSWFQVLCLLSFVWFFGLPGSEDKVLGFVRIMIVYAVLTGGLAWGILRGSKTCYVLNAILQIGGVALGASRGAGPGILVVLWVFAIVHYGRKEWDSLS